MSDSSTSLTIVVSNSSPKRDLQWQPVWELREQGREAVALEVTYDIYGRPQVLKKKAA